MFFLLKIVSDRKYIHTRKHYVISSGGHLPHSRHSFLNSLSERVTIVVKVNWEQETVGKPLSESQSNLFDFHADFGTVLLPILGISLQCPTLRVEGINPQAVSGSLRWHSHTSAGVQVELHARMDNNSLMKREWTMLQWNELMNALNFTQAHRVRYKTSPILAG